MCTGMVLREIIEASLFLQIRNKIISPLALTSEIVAIFYNNAKMRNQSSFSKT
jgi:hypothetical protein